jgi:hypothetical protein
MMEKEEVQKGGGKQASEKELSKSNITRTRWQVQTYIVRLGRERQVKIMVITYGHK